MRSCDLNARTSRAVWKDLSEKPQLCCGPYTEFFDTDLFRTSERKFSFEWISVFVAASPTFLSALKFAGSDRPNRKSCHAEARIKTLSRSISFPIWCVSRGPLSSWCPPSLDLIFAPGLNWLQEVVYNFSRGSVVMFRNGYHLQVIQNFRIRRQPGVQCTVRAKSQTDMLVGSFV